MNFTLGLDYTRAAIHAEWGGSTQSDLPHKGGIVVAACLDAQLHPRAPLVILCGNGPGVRKVSDRLAQQARPLPIFIKQAPQRWVYQGRFQVIESLTEPADCAPYLVSSGRDPAGISQAILLRLIKQGTKTRLHDRLCHWPHWEGSSVSLRS